MIVFESFVQKQKDYVFKRSKKKIDKRKSKKSNNEESQKQKTWNKQGKMTTQGKTHEMKHRRREGSKKQRHYFVFEKLTTENFWIFLGKTDTEMKKKKGKEEVRKEKWDQEQKREKKKWGRTKRRYTKTAMEKKG